jgi:hypothetical protein
MTSKKAVRIVDKFIENRTKHIAELQRPENNWGCGIAATMVNQDIERMTHEISVFKILRKEIAPDCKHPKEMHDICKGQKYCMNCNMDL